jgi:hypothetical protein
VGLGHDSRQHVPGSVWLAACYGAAGHLSGPRHAQAVARAKAAGAAGQARHHRALVELPEARQPATPEAPPALATPLRVVADTRRATPEHRAGRPSSVAERLSPSGLPD